MNARELTVAVTVVVGLTATGARLRADGEKAPPAETVRIGMVSSLFRDTSKPLADALLEPFRALVQAQTGLSTQVTRGGEAMPLGRKISADELHLGLFQGVEFAWARQKYPELRPLMIIVNQQRQRLGVLVVRANSKAEGFADLKGQALAMPSQSRAHCYLFLERGCRDAAQLEPNRFFSSITPSPSSEDALDDLADSTIHAAIVDELALQNYQKRKPARSARLKIIQKSEPFPPTIIAYRPGGLEEKKLKQFQNGMLQANQLPLARQLLMLWRMTAFEPVPADLDDMLKNIIKSYPAPESASEK